MFQPLTNLLVTLSKNQIIKDPKPFPQKQRGSSMNDEWSEEGSRFYFQFSILRQKISRERTRSEKFKTVKAYLNTV